MAYWGEKVTCIGLAILNLAAADGVLTWQTGGTFTFGAVGNVAKSTITEAGAATFATSVSTPSLINGTSGVNIGTAGGTELCTVNGRIVAQSGAFTWPSNVIGNAAGRSAFAAAAPVFMIYDTTNQALNGEVNLWFAHKAEVAGGAATWCARSTIQSQNISATTYGTRLNFITTNTSGVPNIATTMSETGAWTFPYGIASSRGSQSFATGAGANALIATLDAVGFYLISARIEGNTDASVYSSYGFIRLTGNGGARNNMVTTFVNGSGLVLAEGTNWLAIYCYHTYGSTQTVTWSLTKLS